MTNFLENAKKLQPKLIELRHYFHAHPELGHDLSNTKSVVCTQLDKLGIPYTLPESGGIVGYIGKQGGKRILLRADMDALPIVEKTGLAYSSVNPGKMHACGHDMHTTMLLGAAQLLKHCEAEISGEVLLCFQEAEEIMDGSAKMLKSGVFEPFPDHAFALHVYTSDYLPSGTISCTAGKYMSSIDKIHMKIIGKSAHGSKPHNGVNPILAATHIINIATELIHYEIDTQIPAVLTFCTIHGGDADNIIPESCEISGTLRMVDEEKREYVTNRIKEIVKNVEKEYRVSIVLRINGTPMVYNNPEFTMQAHDWIAEMDGMHILEVGSRINMASEDFSEFGKYAPSAMFEIASLSPAGKHFSAHNPCVIFDDSVLYRGSAVYAQVAMRALQSGDDNAKKL